MLAFSICVKAETKEEKGKEWLLTDINPGDPLVRNDFLCYNVTDYIDEEKYSNDVLSYLLDEDSAWFYFNDPVQGIESDKYHPITYRGIVLGESTEEDLIYKYGVGIENRFNEKTDLVYKTFLHQEGEKGFNSMYIRNNTERIIAYNYEDSYQIAFYINSQNVVKGVVFAVAANYKMPYSANEETIKYIQTELNSRNYDCGSVDGKMGNKTKEAIANYQKENGLFESGIVDDVLLKSLKTLSQLDPDNVSDNSSAKIKTFDLTALVFNTLYEIESESGNYSLIFKDGMSFLYNKAQNEYMGVKCSCLVLQDNHLVPQEKIEGEEPVVSLMIIQEKSIPGNEQAFEDLAVTMMHLCDVTLELSDVKAFYNQILENENSGKEFSTGDIDAILLSSPETRVLQISRSDN